MLCLFVLNKALLYIVMSRKGNKQSITIYSNALFICIKQLKS